MRWIGCFLTAAFVALAGLAQANTVTGVKPAQPPADALKPGLATELLSIFVRHVDEIERAGKGRPGPPLPALDNSVGSADDVLGSGEGEGIAFRMRGFLKIEQPGTYQFATMSNDGVRFQLDGKTIVEDPDVHPDRLSEPVSVELQPGWYPLYLLYFQRKGSWTLELLWKAPGMADFEPIPAAHFAHLPS
jgi:hypothetical protein